MSGNVCAHGVSIGKSEHNLHHPVHPFIPENWAMNGIVHNGSTKKAHETIQHYQQGYTIPGQIRNGQPGSDGQGKISGHKNQGSDIGFVSQYFHHPSKIQKGRKGPHNTQINQMVFFSAYFTIFSAFSPKKTFPYRAKDYNCNLI